jgi:hypothetical protein
LYETASRFVNSLSTEQQAAAVFKFGDKTRKVWHFFPDSAFAREYGYPRKGVNYKRMAPEQRRLADALLAAGLSQAGFAKVMAVQTLEEILRVLEKDTTGNRDIDKYYFSIFGEPALDGTWGFRVEGHHLSLNFTFRDGELVSSSPTFLGANPHRVLAGRYRGMRALGKEEDLARSLVQSLDAKQLGQALVAEVAYPDVLTKADSRAAMEGQPTGLPASRMTAQQVDKLMALVAEYARNLPRDVAEHRIHKARQTPPGQLFFAWAGSVQPGAGDYYRVQGPSFLIEYDNTQNNNNHSHSVWRDFAGDFGRDVLARHYRRHHQLQVAQSPGQPLSNGL